MKGGETATRGGKARRRRHGGILCVGDGEAFQQLRKGRIEMHPLRAREREKHLEEGERTEECQGKEAEGERRKREGEPESARRV